MGCSFKAIREDEDDHDACMRATGLSGDKQYGGIEVYSADARVVEESARKGLTKEQTIRAILVARALKDADFSYKTEMEERALLSKLKAKYGEK